MSRTPAHYSAGKHNVYTVVVPPIGGGNSTGTSTNPEHTLVNETEPDISPPPDNGYAASNESAESERSAGNSNRKHKSGKSAAKRNGRRNNGSNPTRFEQSYINEPSEFIIQQVKQRPDLEKSEGPTFAFPGKLNLCYCSAATTGFKCVDMPTLSLAVLTGKVIHVDADFIEFLQHIKILPENFDYQEETARPSIITYLIMDGFKESRSDFMSHEISSILSVLTDSQYAQIMTVKSLSLEVVEDDDPITKGTQIPRAEADKIDAAARSRRKDVDILMSRKGEEIEIILSRQLETFRESKDRAAKEAVNKMMRTDEQKHSSASALDKTLKQIETSYKFSVHVVSKCTEMNRSAKIAETITNLTTMGNDLYPHTIQILHSPQGRAFIQCLVHRFDKADQSKVRHIFHSEGMSLGCKRDSRHVCCSYIDGHECDGSENLVYLLLMNYYRTTWEKYETALSKLWAYMKSLTDEEYSKLVEDKDEKVAMLALYPDYLTLGHTYEANGWKQVLTIFYLLYALISEDDSTIHNSRMLEKALSLVSAAALQK